jgi:hypothetical protein
MSQLLARLVLREVGINLSRLRGGEPFHRAIRTRRTLLCRLLGGEPKTDGVPTYTPLLSRLLGGEQLTFRGEGSWSLLSRLLGGEHWPFPSYGVATLLSRLLGGEQAHRVAFALHKAISPSARSTTSARIASKPTSSSPSSPTACRSR